MRHQAGIPDLFPFEQVGDVGDVSVEPQVHAQKMRAVGEASQRRRVNLMAALLQNVDDLSPAPAAMIGAVNEHEGLARAGLRQRVAAAERRRADTERGAAKRRSSRDRADIRHEILLDRHRVRRIADGLYWDFPDDSRTSLNILGFSSFPQLFRHEKK